jgi:hypothetical protein
MAPSAIGRHLRGRQLHIELLYGVLLLAGCGYLAVRFDPRVAAFEGGLVVGYLLRVWEKMSIYERLLNRGPSREAERVAGEGFERVEDDSTTTARDEAGE